jgi:hypothetical protein
MIITGQSYDQSACPENGRHRDILVIAGTVAADGEHDCAQETPGCAENQKGCGLHVAEADQVGEGILGKSGDQKKDEGDEYSPVLHEIIVLLDDLRVDHPFHERQAQPAGEYESDPRADGESDCGVEGAQNGAVEIPSDKAVDFAGNRCNDHLEDLETDEDHHGEGSERVDEVDDFSPADEEGVEVVIEKQENNGDEQGKQDRYFDDGVFIHRSVTIVLSLPGESFPPRPCARIRFTRSSVKLTKQPEIVKQDIA